jgi:hypothetical protein
MGKVDIKLTLNWKEWIAIIAAFFIFGALFVVLITRLAQTQETFEDVSTKVLEKSIEIK